MTVYSINLHFSVIPGYVAPFSNTLGGHSQKNDKLKAFFVNNQVEK